MSQEQPRIDPERLAEVQSRTIKKGSHRSFEAGMCIMEAVAYVAGEPWSDTPECACPVIASFLRRWNDGIQDDETRTRLLSGLVARLVGTKSPPEIEKRRAYLAIDWSIRIMAPAWLELAGLSEHATLLRELVEITDPQSASVARAIVQKSRDAASAKRDENWAKLRGKYAAAAAAAAAAYAAAAAADAAYAAAAAAYAAAAAAYAAAAAAYAAAAAADAAYAAAAAAYAAAAAAAADAAYAAAAARQALQPTVLQLQQSALELVDRMIQLGGN